MARNMSFAFTVEQMRRRKKTVTRRLGWWFLKPGDVVNAVEKAQGLKKGEKVKRICQIRIVSTRKEPLYKIDKSDCVLEGFTGWTPGQFVGMFCSANKCKSYTKVNRIEFEFLD